MIVLSIALSAIGCLVAMSLRANARYRDETRLPMQWSLNGSVNWTAPRRIALSFTPLLATCVLTAAAVSTLVLEPRRGQEGAVIPAALALALMFVGVHAFHLWLIGRTVGKDLQHFELTAAARKTSMHHYDQIRWLRFVPLLFVLLGLPLTFGAIAPNAIYGVRTASTLASEASWYNANFWGGLVAVVFGVGGTFANVIADRSRSLTSGQKMWVVIATPLLVAMVMSGVAFSTD